MFRLLLLMLLLLACEPSKKASELTPNRMSVLSVKFPSFLPANSPAFVPTEAELRLTQKLILERLAIYNAEQNAKTADLKFEVDSLRYTYEVLHFDQYYKQCIPLVNSKGEKILFFNCMCDVEGRQEGFNDWRKYYMRTSDGGSCYFGIWVNLTRQAVFGFNVNGEA